MSQDLRILIVAEHASAQFGGEAALPLHYFRVLRERGFKVWLVTHERTKAELSALFPDDNRILYVRDTSLHRLMWRISRQMPSRIAYFTAGFVLRFSAQLEQRKIIHRIIAENTIDVIHQPMPVSPREPSMIYGFGVPVIIGPMNGGMDYPPAFRHGRRISERLLLKLGRSSSTILNRLMPGKRLARMLLVANSRTRQALPPGVCSTIIQLVENGVDIKLWRRDSENCDQAVSKRPTTFAFVGRLVDWKAVDILLYAYKKASERVPMRLLIIGDGIERKHLESLALELDILAFTTDDVERVHFTGWLSQRGCAETLRSADCLVLTSLLECGGAVVLEAMCMQKPVIATAWGGPADYLDDRCGILVPPITKEKLIQGFADAMTRLATSPEARIAMGQFGQEKVAREFDWEVKVDKIIEIYRSVRLPL